MSPMQFLALPAYGFQILTSAKNFDTNPVLGSRRLNRWGLHRWRVRLAHRLAVWRRQRLARTIPAQHREAFERDGFVIAENFLDPAHFEQLRRAVLDTPAPSREMIQGGTVTRRQSLEDEPYRSLEPVQQLLQNTLWNRLIGFVGSFGSRPLVYVQTILANRLGNEPDLQSQLHADTFHSTVKAWLFVTDVALEDGPFCYVPGSHRLTRERLEWEHDRSLVVSDADLLSNRGSPRVDEAKLAQLGLPPPRTLAVPANTLVVADTFGFHARVAATRPSVRVEVWAYGRRNPFLPWLGADFFSLPGLAWRRVPFLWAVRDRFERWIGQPWLDVGTKRAGDLGCHGDERAGAQLPPAPVPGPVPAPAKPS